MRWYRCFLNPRGLDRRRHDNRRAQWEWARAESASWGWSDNSSMRGSGCASNYLSCRNRGRRCRSTSSGDSCSRCFTARTDGGPCAADRGDYRLELGGRKLAAEQSGDLGMVVTFGGSPYPRRVAAATVSFLSCFFLLSSSSWISFMLFFNT